MYSVFTITWVSQAQSATVAKLTIINGPHRLASKDRKPTSNYRRMCAAISKA